MNKSTPASTHGPQKSTHEPLFPAYPPSAPAPADLSPLSPEQISVVDSDDALLPSDEEVAEALGIQQAQLSDEIRDEERQRHPELPMDDQNPRE